jgi:hypothetical protein
MKSTVTTRKVARPLDSSALAACAGGDFTFCRKNPGRASGVGGGGLVVDRPVIVEESVHPHRVDADLGLFGRSS